MFQLILTPVLFLSILTFSQLVLQFGPILAFSVSWRNLKRLSFYFTKVLDELEKYLELFDEYSDLKEPSRNVFFYF